MEIRLVRSEEYEEAGRVVVEAYGALPGEHMTGDYAAELGAVADRAGQAEVYVALAGGGGIAGCVTFVPDRSSPLAELLEEGEAQIRMLGVAPAAQNSGLGAALVEVCISRARELGNTAVLLHTTPWMPVAHRLYERAGFVRFPERDWLPVPEVPLLAYRLDLASAATA